MKTLGKLLILISAYIAEGCKLAWYHIKREFLKGYYLSLIHI